MTSQYLLSIFYRLFTSRRMRDKKNTPLGVASGIHINTFGIYWVPSKTCILVLSAVFCREVVDWLIYNTFMLMYDTTPNGMFLDLPCSNYYFNIQKKIGSKCVYLI